MTHVQGFVLVFVQFVIWFSDYMPSIVLSLRFSGLVNPKP